MQAHEARDRPARLLGVVLGVFLGALLDLPEGLVGRIAGEHVHDEALLDRLAHRVEVKRFVQLCLRVQAPEHLQRAPLGGGGEGEIGEVALPAAARTDRLGQCLLDRVDRSREQSGVLGLRGGQLLLLASPQRKAQILGGLARLGGVRLIDHNRVVARGELADLVDHERKLLQRRDDDARPLAFQCCDELIGVLVDLHHHAARMLELEDRVLQLAVEHDAVGDDDHLVEHLAVVRHVHGREAVRGPGDRVRLARPGGVLDQVGVPRTVRGRIGLELLHRVPLVVAGEDHLLRRAPCCLRALLGALDVDEAVQDVEPRVHAPHTLPQVGRPVAVGVWRVALAEVVAHVERQKARRLPVEAGGHRDGVRVDRKVHKRAAGQRDVLGVSVVAVLLDRLLDALAGEVVLQLRRRHRDAVEEQA